MTTQQTPDLLALFTALLALGFTPSLSAVLAPYVVVIIGALLGTGWGLKRRAPDAKPGAWGFALLMVGSSLVFSMPAAVWLQHYLPGTYQWLLAPVAALIAAVGDDWPRVGTWAAETGGKLLTRRAEGS